jgi:hypothetical protein
LTPTPDKINNTSLSFSTSTQEEVVKVVKQSEEQNTKCIARIIVTANNQRQPTENDPYI